MSNRPEYIVVGRFGRPRGVSGEIFVNVLTDNPERFGGPGMFWIETENGWTEIDIVSVKFVSGRPAVRLRGIDNSGQARRLTNSFLYIKGSDLDKAPEGSYYYFDLIDCEVVDTHGRELGKIVEVEPYPASDIWVIEKEGRKIMFPAVAQFIKKVDIENKLIELDPPEGIFDSPDTD